MVKNAGLDYRNDAAQYSAKKTDITITPYRRFVLDYPNETSYYQPILDVLDYSPSKLECIPSVAMLEGKNDYYVMQYVQSVALAERKCINLLPGNGAGSIETAIRLYIAWGLEFVVILDSDNEGQKQKMRYMNVFGVALTNRIFTLSDVDPSWVNYEMDNLFTAEERTEIQKLAYPQASDLTKTHFNRSIQELLLTRRPCNISAESKDRFTRLLDFITERLRGNPHLSG